MGGVQTGGGDDKLNVELNLVPFIDLLSSLVLFLLLTTVWIHVGTVPVSSESRGTNMASSESKSTTLFIHLTQQGFEISLKGSMKVPSSLPKTLPAAKAGFDQDRLLSILKNSFPQAKPETATISAADNVAYKHIIATIDSVKGAGFPSVAMATD